MHVDSLSEPIPRNCTFCLLDELIHCQAEFQHLPTEAGEGLNELDQGARNSESNKNHIKIGK